MDALTLGEIDPLAGELHRLAPTANEVHFDTPELGIVKRMMPKRIEIECTLEFSIDPQQKLIPTLDKLRKKRNIGAYDDYGLISEQEADHCGKLAFRIRQEVEQWIRKNHAENLAKSALGDGAGSSRRLRVKRCRERRSNIKPQAHRGCGWARSHAVRGP